jgi:hypothetical protein
MADGIVDGVEGAVALGKVSSSSKAGGLDNSRSLQRRCAACLQVAPPSLSDSKTA